MRYHEVDVSIDTSTRHVCLLFGYSQLENGENEGAIQLFERTRVEM